MNLPEKAQQIEIFYDGRCGMCSYFADWLENQEQEIELVCEPYQGQQALQRFPELPHYHPEREMVVRIDRAEVYQGAEAWVYCLWSCTKYREVARLMNTRLMLPLAKKVCYLVAKNRLVVSKLFFGKKEKAIRAELDKLEVEVAECSDENCKVEINK